MSSGSERTERRYFWGQTLRQALSRAARIHQIAPDELDYRPVEKRHGFVKQPRRFLIEVDPLAPRRTPAPVPGADSPAKTSHTPRATGAGASAPEARLEHAERREARQPGVRERGREAASGAPSPRRPAPAAEPPVAPDEEAALAASVAMSRLLRFAGLTLDVAVERQPERLDLRLSGTDEERLRELGAALLDDLGHLLPRLVKSLSGKQVLCRIDGAGIRSAREEELRDLARRSAEEVLRTGQPVLLDPLPPADRRIVHLALAEEPRLSTESQGHGVEKRLRIAIAAAGAPPAPQS